MAKLHPLLKPCRQNRHFLASQLSWYIPHLHHFQAIGKNCLQPTPLILFRWWSPSGETFGNLRSLILSSKSAFVLFRSLLPSQINNQVSAFMTENGVFSEYQYGFRKARSCYDLLVATIDDWHLAQDANKLTAIAFIDLSRAFDNVRHATLRCYWCYKKLGLAEQSYNGFSTTCSTGNNVSTSRYHLPRPKGSPGGAFLARCFSTFMCQI